jgi:RNA polymerase sigma-70 factor (ECF subfamily)
MLAQFLQAVGTGELEGMLQLLSDEVVMWADSGGKVRGVLRPIRGRDAVARFLLASPRIPTERLQPDIVDVNGEPTLLLRAGSEVCIVLFISLDQGQVDQIWVIGNPGQAERDK